MLFISDNVWTLVLYCDKGLLIRLTNRASFHILFLEYWLVLRVIHVSRLLDQPASSVALSGTELVEARLLVVEWLDDLGIVVGGVVDPRRSCLDPRS